MLILFIIFIQLLIFIIQIYKDVSKHKINNYEDIKLIFFNRFFKIFNKKDILIHGASCGEVNSLEILTDYLKNNNISYYLSVQSLSGYFLSKRNNKNTILKPYESIISIFIMFIQIRPKVLIISESDSWPTYLLISWLLNIKLIYINYTLKNDKKCRNFFHNLFASKIFLKTNQKIPNYLIKKKYKFIGNFKILSSDVNNNLSKIENSILFASSHFGELETHIQMFKSLEKYTIIYVPRNLDFKNYFIEKTYELKNLNWCKTNSDIKKFHINIFWEIGILKELYNLTQITILGGTFDNTGGHNIVEPISSNNLVIIGPNYHTIKDLVEIFSVVFVNKNNYIHKILNYDKSIISKNINILKKYKKNFSKDLKHIFKKNGIIPDC